MAGGQGLKLMPYYELSIFDVASHPTRMKSHDAILSQISCIGWRRDAIMRIDSQIKIQKFRPRKSPTP